ncbi:P-loop containing nucleoside triphosphate hydrolases superfamily protein [Striga hermonthica]|uniref:P-loop containing nucleoside triphosphate hydrolases superfamily protein n=1 Tax=Striga hermonthica TaxID=68872 RepID=A0A9N7MF60_STRHE|nr:P-loop containing nucleoside triphosphate hydrolases superfamily protein [Striga hermonthica]
MEHEASQSVRVAVNIRPLVTSELLVGSTDCITVYPAEKQVQIGSHAFTFDNIFGGKASSCSSIFEECVSPLVDALFHGYNATVLAYGQTGSGKTYTMGTNYNGEDHSSGVIPKVMDTIFSRVETMKESTEFLIRVSFIEIFKEEVFDLLDPKTTGPARVPIQIRERVSGGIALAGVTEAEVRTKEEMASYLLQGSLCRATGSTNMNTQSSRSHAIFTISMELKRSPQTSAGDDADDLLVAKLHLVDLAGSERAKRTGADGTRLQEGIHINKGLLALGNVISALGDEKKRKEGGHVPYRDSKLTRILQDSLGGNSKTIMIACISPADTNAEETLNTLKYANRARNIQNKAIINRDPEAAQLQRMQSQIEQLQAELLYFRGDSSAPAEEIQILKHKISLLEKSKMELQEALQEYKTNYKHLTQRAIDAQVERDRLIMQIESIQNGKPMNEIDINSNKDFDMVKSYIMKIQDLESELIKVRSLNQSRRDDFADYLDSEDDGNHSGNSYIVDADMRTEKDGMVEVVEKELEHSSLQEKLDRELKELDKRLEQKEAEMKQFVGSDTSILKQHYEKKVQDLELEKGALQKEIEELRRNLANISSNSDDSAHKLKEEYLQKLNVLEKQVAELKKKQDAQAQLLRQKQKSDEAARRLQDEIHRIKTHKVQLQQKIKQESEQFRQWKASREKEVLQLKKEGRRNEYEMHKLLALNQRQKLVLQRKTEEAAMATKRLKELLDSRKASRETPGINKGPGAQALVQAIEHELEVTVGVHEVRSEYERQMKERSKMAEEIARLKEEALLEKQHKLSETPQSMSPGARNSRIHALENMLSTSSSALVSMASQLSEAEERERAFSGRGRWKNIRSLPEAKNIMNFLFNVASSSRCQLKDREFDCREKDLEIRDLKEKVFNLVRQLEHKKTELSRQENLVKLALERPSNETKVGSGYVLRPKGSCNSTSSSGVYESELLEDMDTSDESEEDVEWGHTVERKGRQTRRKEKLVESICCSCSKSSFCKTSRCECRAVMGSCSISCSCGPTKCSNRKESSGNLFERDEKESNNDELASHGAMMLQTAFTEKPAGPNDAETMRKPLSDIGNNLVLPSIPKPNISRKKWRKSVIQLVPTTPAAAQAQPNAEVTEQPKINAETDIPLKLPRAIRSTLSNNNHLKERNLDQPNEPINDDNCTPSLVSARQQATDKNGKENRGL